MNLNDLLGPPQHLDPQLTKSDIAELIQHAEFLEIWGHHLDECAACADLFESLVVEEPKSDMVLRVSQAWRRRVTWRHGFTTQIGEVAGALAQVWPIVVAPTAGLATRTRGSDPGQGLMLYVTFAEELKSAVTMKAQGLAIDNEGAPVSASEASHPKEETLSSSQQKEDDEPLSSRVLMLLDRNDEALSDDDVVGTVDSFQESAWSGALRSYFQDYVRETWRSIERLSSQAKVGKKGRGREPARHRLTPSSGPSTSTNDAFAEAREKLQKRIEERMASLERECERARKQCAGEVVQAPVKFEVKASKDSAPLSDLLRKESCQLDLIVRDGGQVLRRMLPDRATVVTDATGRTQVVLSPSQVQAVCETGSRIGGGGFGRGQPEGRGRPN